MKRKLRMVALCILSLVLLFSIGGTALAAEKVVTMQEYQQAVLKYGNNQRAKNKLAALVLDDSLSEIAEQLALEQKGHLTSLRPNGQEWSAMLEDMGYAAQISARNYIVSPANLSAIALTNEWMRNAGHKANLLNGDFTHTGIYAHYFIDEEVYYFIQIFAKPSSNAVVKAENVLYQGATNTSVTLRKTPNLKGKAAGSLGKSVEVSVAAVEGGWAKLFWFNNEYVYVPVSQINKLLTRIDKQPPTVTEVFEAKVTKDSMLYSGPGAMYAKTGSVKKGDTIYIASLYSGEKAADWMWASVMLNGKNAFMLSSNAKFDSNRVPVTVPKSSPGDYGIAKLTQNAKVHIGPGAKYPVRGQLERDDIVAVNFLNGRWAQIVYLSGYHSEYVSTDYLDWIDE